MKLRTLVLAGAAGGLAWQVLRPPPSYGFRGRSVLITGGSRGLGIVLARQLAAEGARLTLLARDGEELRRAAKQIHLDGNDLLLLPCDVRRHDQVETAIRQVVDWSGGLDVLINCAGTIQVSPLEHLTLDDFAEAMAVNFYGPLEATLAALPHMGEGGRIVNVTSIGGRVAFPHLLPYSASKAALIALSDGLRAELGRRGVAVTTVCPGMMRTGSPRHAWFKGRHREEYAWFAALDSLPLVSMSAERAARRILDACRRGSPWVTLGLPARLGVVFQAVAPGLTARALELVERLLPDPLPDPETTAHQGFESTGRFSRSFLTFGSDRAAKRNNELPDNGA